MLIALTPTQAGSITDAHAIVAGTPVTDVCTQDWTLLSAEKGTGGLVFEAERALETGDSQDRAFTDDSAEGDTFVTRTSTMNAIHIYIRRMREYLRV